MQEWQQLVLDVQTISVCLNTLNVTLGLCLAIFKCFYIVSLCNYVQESEEVLGNGDMQDLVTCALIQEKLYTAEKCIGPNTLQKPSNDQH